MILLTHLYSSLILSTLFNVSIDKPNTNLSQFFITLGDCEWLNRKHTIFGKVTGMWCDIKEIFLALSSYLKDMISFLLFSTLGRTGNTIFNLLRMSDVECGDDDRPVEDIVVKSIEVLWNPFDDIIPR